MSLEHNRFGVNVRKSNVVSCNVPIVDRLICSCIVVFVSSCCGGAGGKLLLCTSSLSGHLYGYPSLGTWIAQSNF